MASVVSPWQLEGGGGGGGEECWHCLIGILVFHHMKLELFNCFFFCFCFITSFSIIHYLGDYSTMTFCFCRDVIIMGCPEFRVVTSL